MKISSKILGINAILLILLLAFTIFLFKEKVLEFHRQSFIDDQISTGQNISEIISTIQPIGKISSEDFLTENSLNKIHMVNELLKRIKNKNSSINQIYSVFYDKDKNIMFYSSHSDIYENNTVVVNINLNQFKVFHDNNHNRLNIEYNNKLYNYPFEIQNDRERFQIGIDQNSLEFKLNTVPVLKFNNDNTASVLCAPSTKSLKLSPSQPIVDTKCNLGYASFLIKYHYYQVGQSNVLTGDKFKVSSELLNMLKTQIIDQNQNYINQVDSNPFSSAIKSYVPIIDSKNQAVGFVCIESSYHLDAQLIEELRYPITFFVGFLLITLILLKYIIDSFIKNPTNEILYKIQYLIKNKKNVYDANLKLSEKNEFNHIDRAIEEYLKMIKVSFEELEQSVFEKNKELHTTILNLKEQENRMQQIIQQSPSGMILANHENVIELVNPVVSRIFNLTPKELLNQKLGTILPSITKEQCNQCQYKICESQFNVCQISINTPFNKTKQLLVSKSQIFDYYDHFVTLYIIHDLSELKNKDREYLALLNTISENLLIHRDGMIMFINHPLCHLLGYSEQEFYGHHLYEFTAEEEQSMLKEYLSQSYYRMTQSLQLNPVNYSLFLTLVHKNKSRIKFNISSQEYLYQNQKVELVKLKMIQNESA